MSIPDYPVLWLMLQPFLSPAGFLMSFCCCSEPRFSLAISWRLYLALPYPIPATGMVLDALLPWNIVIEVADHWPSSMTHMTSRVMTDWPLLWLINHGQVYHHYGWLTVTIHKYAGWKVMRMITFDHETAGCPVFTTTIHHHSPPFTTLHHQSPPFTTIHHPSRFSTTTTLSQAGGTGPRRVPRRGCGWDAMRVVARYQTRMATAGVCL